MKKLDLAGKTFGKLVCQEIYGRDRSGHLQWKCLCECGDITYATVQNLRSGNTTSCGCAVFERRTKRDLGDPHEFAQWKKMFAGYSSVYKPWSDFNTFLTDMGHAPTPDAVIIRKDPNGLYNPRNCMWSDAPTPAAKPAPLWRILIAQHVRLTTPRTTLYAISVRNLTTNETKLLGSTYLADSTRGQWHPGVKRAIAHLIKNEGLPAMLPGEPMTDWLERNRVHAAKPYTHSRGFGYPDLRYVFDESQIVRNTDTPTK